MRHRLVPGILKCRACCKKNISTRIRILARHGRRVIAVVRSPRLLIPKSVTLQNKQFQANCLQPVWHFPSGGRWRVAGGCAALGATTGLPPISALRPDGRWKILSVRYFQGRKPVEILIQRPSGRKSVSACIPEGAPQSRLPSGYYPPPIRAKNHLSVTKIVSPDSRGYSHGHPRQGRTDNCG